MPDLMRAGDHWALRSVVDPSETDAGISFLVGLVSGFGAAASRSRTDLTHLRAQEGAVLAEMVAAAADHEVSVGSTDLDDVPAADGDHHVNYFYGRLAAFDAVLSD